MAKNYVEDGDTIDFIAAADHKSGDLIALDALMVVVLNDVASGASGVGATTGVWDVAKSAGTAVAQGAQLFLKDGNIGTDETGQSAGIAWADADAAATHVPMKLNG